MSSDSLFLPVHDTGPDASAADPATPGLFALDVKKGSFIWRAPSPRNVCGQRLRCESALGQAITATPELVFAGADDGHLRIYDAANGAVLWDTDTAHEFATTNGVAASGGSLAEPCAPVAYAGMLLVSTGSDKVMPGNVLLAYEVANASSR